MLSAFGIDHGGVSKSATKVARRIAGMRSMPKAGDTFQERMKVNYVQGRTEAKHLGQREVNPNKWKKHDAETAAWTEKEYGKKGWNPGQRIADARQKNQFRAVKNARTRKEFAMRSVDAHSANARRTRKLP